jgi:hypothetical protein
MNASKENAAMALGKLDRAGSSREDRQFIRDFLEAAKRKLPSEAAYARAKAKTR